MRTLILVLPLLLPIWLAISDCGTSSKSGLSIEKMEIGSIRLNADEPGGFFVIDTASMNQKELMFELRMSEIDNPERHPIFFEATFEAVMDTGIMRRRMGYFSPYPADEPSSFILPVTNTCSELGTVLVCREIRVAVRMRHDGDIPPNVTALMKLFSYQPR